MLQNLLSILIPSHENYSLFFFLGCLLAIVLDFITAKFTQKDTEITDEMIEQISIEHNQKQITILQNQSPHDSDPLIATNKIDDEDEVISAKDRKHLLFVSIITAVALSVHNFPEGLATFTAAMDSSKMGITLGIAMIIHNCPEGMAVAIPTFFATKSKTIAIVVTAISGAAQPIGALFGWVILKNEVSHFTFGMMFGLVAGIMTFITLEELIPNANRYDREDKVTSKFLLLGMLVVAMIIMFT